MSRALSLANTHESDPMRKRGWDIVVRQELRRLAAVEQELAELKAARIAYASEFAPDAEGNPDVGSIHQNIRAMKQELADLKAAMGEPMAWLSDESVRRLARGGNDSRGTVPVHAVRSGVSCNPLYAIKAAK